MELFSTNNGGSLSAHLLDVRFPVQLNRNRKIKIGKSSSCKNFCFIFLSIVNKCTLV